MMNTSTRGTRLPTMLQDIIRNKYNTGKSVSTIALELGLDDRTVKKYCTNHVPPTLGRPTTNTSHTLIRFVELLHLLDPTLYLWELQNLIQTHCGVSVSTSYLCRIRKHVLKLTKRRLTLVAQRRSTERVQLLRKSFRQTIKCFLLQQLVFVDETHVDRRDLCRRYGYIREGTEIEIHQHHLNRESYSVIMGMTKNMMLKPYIKNTYHSGVDSADFLAFLQSNRSMLRVYHVVVLDNAKIHRTQDIVDWLEANSISYLFLPPYSPDYNAIELVFALLKGKMKRYTYQNGTIENIIRQCLSQITSDHLAGFVRHVSRRYDK